MATIAITGVFSLVSPVLEFLLSAQAVLFLTSLFSFIGVLMDLRLVSYVLDAIPIL